MTRKEIKDLGILIQFTAVFCKVHHKGPKQNLKVDDPALQEVPLRRDPLCGECQEFLLYALQRRIACPLEDRPSCKHCHIHCYRPGHRDKVRQIMRFSGQYLIRRGRLDLLWHYLF